MRLATLHALQRIGLANSSFALACQDILVEMITDDMESVRRLAVSSLQRVARAVLLRREQLHVVVGALQEASMTMRHALHAMLGASRLASAEHLITLVEALIRNLGRYPQACMLGWSEKMKFSARV